MVEAKIDRVVQHTADDAYYNTGVIPYSDRAVLVARKVRIADVRPERPDIGPLVVFEHHNGSAPTPPYPLFDNSHGGVNFEDARCFRENGTIMMGMTAVVPIGGGEHGVYPAVAKLTYDGQRLQAGEPYIERGLEGKNVTPIGNNRVWVRLRGESHRFHQYVVNGHGFEFERIIDFTQFRDRRPWMRGMVGTVVAPIPLEHNPGEKLVLIHGYPPRQETNGTYNYQIGTALIGPNDQVWTVSSTPLFDRRTFDDILPWRQELHDTRNVVYCCGVTQNHDEGTTTLYVNVGDLMIATAEYPTDGLERHAAS